MLRPETTWPGSDVQLPEAEVPEAEVPEEEEVQATTLDSGPPASEGKRNPDGISSYSDGRPPRAWSQAKEHNATKAIKKSEPMRPSLLPEPQEPPREQISAEDPPIPPPGTLTEMRKKGQLDLNLLGRACHPLAIT